MPYFYNGVLDVEDVIAQTRPDTSYYIPLSARIDRANKFLMMFGDRAVAMHLSAPTTILPSPYHVDVKVNRTWGIHHIIFQMYMWWKYFLPEDLGLARQLRQEIAAIDMTISMEAV